MGKLDFFFQEIFEHIRFLNMLNKQSVIFMNVKRIRIQRETKLLLGRSFQHMDTYGANGIKVLHVCHDMTVMNHTPINTGIVCNSKSFYFVSIFDFPLFSVHFPILVKFINPTMPICATHNVTATDCDPSQQKPGLSTRPPRAVGGSQIAIE